MTENMHYVMQIRNNVLVVYRVTCCWISQLSTNNKCIFVVPVVLTHTSPDSTETNLHNALLRSQAIAKSDCTSGVTLGTKKEK